MAIFRFLRSYTLHGFSGPSPLRVLPALVTCLPFLACQSLERSPMLLRSPGVQLLGEFDGVRATAGRPAPNFHRSFSRGLQTRILHWARNPEKVKEFEVLVLGAGGPNGSFGAGLLCGWTESGTRPMFDIVTGVSAGALLSPFAFVGESADPTLETLFARLAPKDIYRQRTAISGLLGESLMKSKPLQGLIAKHIDGELIDQVAEGHEMGRRLYVGTTDFDVGKLVVWDMGAIATRRTPEAHDLFRKVLLASASIPIFYPPVLFPIRDENGQEGDEMHVDGGVSSPMFLPNQVVNTWKSIQDTSSEVAESVRSAITVIHNGAIVPTVEPMERDTMNMAIRSYLLVSWAMVQEDITHLYVLSKLWDSEFRFACVPDDGEVNIMDFTTDDTNRLFEEGRARGLNPDSWLNAPPDFLVTEEIRQIQPLRNREE